MNHDDTPGGGHRHAAGASDTMLAWAIALTRSASKLLREAP